MNKSQKEVIQAQLDNEKETLEKLRGIYQKSLDDINSKLAELIGREANADENKLQSIIYQKQYQQALKQQISGILDNLNGEQFKSISEYLTKSYENGFYGTMYDLHSQSIPLILPINQEQVVQALQTDSKISEGLYKKLGEDTNLLKKRIANNISRGIAQGSGYAVIAKTIAGGMIGYNPNIPGGAFARAMRITRTEGNRINNTAHMNAQKKAIEKGANILKQWDATLDVRTRSSHAKVDGEIREYDEKFSNGLLFPSDPNGSAEEVINCRCTVLQRAKWALDEEELQILQDRAKYFGLDKTDNFEDFKKKYIKAVDNSGESGIIKISSPIRSRKHPTGTPEGVGLFGDKLNRRQLIILGKLPEYDSRCIVSKKSVSMRDLSALTAHTNVEFAMFTKGNERLIVRGDVQSVNIDLKEANELARKGYRWSGHTHPGASREVLFPSGDDRKILNIFGQNNSVTYNSLGKFYVFGKAEW